MSITSTFIRRPAPLFAGLAVASALVVSAADGQTGRTLVFSSPAGGLRELKQFDVGRRGTSIGDHFVVAGALRADGRIAGRGHATCTVIDRRYKGQDCDFVLVFGDGTVTASGGGLDRLLPGQSETPPHSPDEYAITGGTGAYRGASGTLSIQEHEDGSNTIRVSL